MPAFRGWAVMPKIGAGSAGDPIRPAFDLARRTAGDRTEHIIGGPNRCLVAVDVSDDALLAGGVVLATHADLPKAFAALPAATRNRIATALADLGETDTSGTLAAVLRRAGRRLSPNFEPALHLTAGTPNPTGSFLNDTFTDTSGTAIVSHTGETGAIWSNGPGLVGTGGVITDANRLRNSSGSGTAEHYPSGSPAGVEYDLDFTIRCVTYGSGFWAGVTARMSTSVETFYYVRNHPSLGTWNLYKFITGTQTDLGSYTQTLVANTDYPGQIQVRDATKKLFLGGVERISTTDNAITSAGKAGVIIGPGGSDSTGQHLDSITATDLVASALSVATRPDPMRSLIGR